jgi:tetraacyldisaccharide 4'-kinase
LLREHPEVTVIVLDDAYQHRAVRPTLNILLTELARPFYEDYVLPAGRLRESRAGAQRADIVIVTKCPHNISEASQQAAAQHIRHYSQPGVPVLFSAYEYAAPQALPDATAPVLPTYPTAGLAVLLTGIAQPGPLCEYLEEQGYNIQYHAHFPDHHAFAPADLTALRAHWQPGWPIFTTEKDATRLLMPELRAARVGLPLYTIPVRVAFLGGGSAVLRRLLPNAPAAGA